ncbi:MAG: class IV adenylate cyclase [Thermodesulfobacteriota bacterium]|nr:class IV adenylate cyclase [Thermodesulfobacteriota bacterium]
MTEPLEIEVKFYLGDVAGVRERILALGATSCGRVFEANIRFEDEARGLKERGVLLRLRKDDKARLTFKSPPSNPDEDFKIHRELEIEVDDFETCRAILEDLGFHEEQAYEKWRETFTLGETKLLVDTMPYGTFLEIEGEKADIRHISNLLDLKWEERILLNYLEIFDIVRQEEHLAFNDITFENFRVRPVEIGRYVPLLCATHKRVA